MAAENTVSIGIDLGTTFSCVGVWKNSRVEIIPNDQGNRTTPSYVAFTDTGHLIGDAAKSQVSNNPFNTVFDAKRLIGRRFSDASVQSDIKNFSYKVSANEDDKPYVQVCHKGEEIKFTPEEISAKVISKMKAVAEAYLDSPVKSAVITVPAYFNDAQRMATRDAGVIAGLDVLRIINEPTAAAIAYGLGQKREEEQGKERTVLIFDLGGGTFDVSLLSVTDGVFQVKSTAGNTHLGGEDFDNRVVKHFMAEFKRQSQHDISSNASAMRRLHTACENAKIQLSASTQAAVHIDSLHEGVDLDSTISRAKFEELCLDLFRLTMDPVERVLNDAKVKKEEVDDIVMVGGSTRIPRVQQMISNFFDGKTLCKDINPDEAVAYGATVQAAVLSGDKSDLTKDLLLLDVTPLSLGIETAGGNMSTMIKRNTTIPTSRTENFSTNEDDQDMVEIQVFEGERNRTKHNNKLGTFQLQDIPKARRGIPDIIVTFNVDANGILNVSAEEKGSGKKNKITIANDKGRLTKEEVERMVEEAEKFKEETAKEIKESWATPLGKGCVMMKIWLETAEFEKEIEENERRGVEEEINKISKWTIENKQASKEEYDFKMDDLKALVKPILEKMKNEKLVRSAETFLAMCTGEEQAGQETNELSTS